ncbi:disulfide bond formation protein B [Humitalea sp. 24SJ18S-53]|uniref:disulfide bond formation protein B n=1 Tax=Humitalea sp. 24SJ18S-53 TaxID=3422307 RepID=UPI003D66EB33
MNRALVAGLVAVLAAAAPLMAMASERFAGLAPCALCLWQRWPYWVAAALAALAVAWPGGRRWLLVLAGLAVLASAGVAVMHVGVEQGLWPSPLAACQAATSGGAMSIDDMLAAMAPRPAKPCDEPAYLIPGLPVSMAAMNLIYALALAGFAFTGARRRIS